ncbi:MAG: ABC transporter permease [Pelolinea sp.]|nr:ABC transporter permease [Pelolinea sp.]
METIFTVESAKIALEMGAPLLLAALGGIVSDKSGVLNLGTDGIMLMGAFFGFWGAYVSGSLWLGLLMAALIGGILGLLIAFFSVTIKADQVVTGVSVVILCGGISSYLFRMFSTAIPGSPTIEVFKDIKIPFLSDISIIGPIIFKNNILVFLGFILVLLIWVLFYRTSIGLAIRAVGENPLAADTLGVNVAKIRYGCVIFSCVMAGIAGAFLSLVRLGSFQYNMTGGRGWIAIAVVIFSGRDPFGVLLGSMLFGGIDALQLRLQARNVPIYPQFILMLPYIFTLLALLTVSKRRSSPKALTIPYSREEGV